MDGGDGDDVIFDRVGTDTILGGAGNDTVNISFDYTTIVTDRVAPGSVAAGSGNDTVIIDNRFWGRAFAIDLGDGDDILRLNGAADSVILGAGRDTIVYSPNSTNDGSLVVFDFTAGDAGDIFDLTAFLEGPLRYSQARFLIERGLNPFELGVVELRQVGNHVELFVHPEGITEDGYAQHPVRFLNTTVGQLTAANFGGYDPQARPNLATIVNGDVTIAPGEVREAVNVTPAFDLSAHFVYHSFNGATPDFVNHGTVTTRLTNVAYGHLAGVYVVQGRTAGGSFVNAADGTFVVRGEWVDETGDRSMGWTYGFYLQCERQERRQRRGDPRLGRPRRGSR